MRPLLVAVLVAAGCATRFSIPDDAEHRAHGEALAEAAIEAHGGRARWQAIGGVRLRLRTDGPMAVYPPETRWLIDPLRNRAAWTYEERGKHVEVRFDGTRAAILEDGRCVGSRRDRERAAHLSSNLAFWFGLPWKLRDPGSHLRAAPSLPLHAGAPLSPRFLVTYSVGMTPRDWFVVWLDPETRRIARVEYVASAFSEAVRLTGEWERYAEVEGLALVARRVHRPQAALLRAMARPFVQALDEIEVHLPLRDEDFAVRCP